MLAADDNILEAYLLRANALHRRALAERRREFCHSAAPPSAFSRRFNSRAVDEDVILLDHPLPSSRRIGKDVGREREQNDRPPGGGPRLNLTAKALDHLSAALQVTQP